MLPVWNGHSCPFAFDVGFAVDLDVALDPANRPSARPLRKVPYSFTPNCQNKNE